MVTRAGQAPATEIPGETPASGGEVRPEGGRYCTGKVMGRDEGAPATHQCRIISVSFRVPGNRQHDSHLQSPHCRFLSSETTSVRVQAERRIEVGSGRGWAG